MSISRNFFREFQKPTLRQENICLSRVIIGGQTYYLKETVSGMHNTCPQASHSSLLYFTTRMYSCVFPADYPITTMCHPPTQFWLTHALLFCLEDPSQLGGNLADNLVQDPQQDLRDRLTFVDSQILNHYFFKYIFTCYGAFGSFLEYKSSYVTLEKSSDIHSSFFCRICKDFRTAMCGTSKSWKCPLKTHFAKEGRKVEMIA